MPKAKKKSSGSIISEGKKIKVGNTTSSNSKSKKRRTVLQNEAAIRNLKKAREAKKQYAQLRKEGFSRENVARATSIIDSQLSRLSSFEPERNPAVANLLEEIGGQFPTADELAAMPKSEYYKYATSLRSFLGNPFSDEKSVDKLFDKILFEVVGTQLTRKKNERISAYHRRRKEFINEHKDTAKQAFELYRMLEETHAGVILRGKISPNAYGSDNLITDLFDFVENDYDGDRDAALAYWRETLQNQYNWEESTLANSPRGTKLSKFDWTGREKYESFVRRNYKKF